MRDRQRAGTDSKKNENQMSRRKKGALVKITKTEVEKKIKKDAAFDNWKWVEQAGSVPCIYSRERVCSHHHSIGCVGILFLINPK